MDFTFACLVLAEPERPCRLGDVVFVGGCDDERRSASQRRRHSSAVDTTVETGETPPDAN